MGRLPDAAVLFPELHYYGLDYGGASQSLREAGRKKIISVALGFGIKTFQIHTFCKH